MPALLTSTSTWNLPPPLLEKWALALLDERVGPRRRAEVGPAPRAS